MPNFLVVEGTILPQNNVACGLEKGSCLPQLCYQEDLYDLQEITAAGEALATERCNDSFWRARLVHAMMASKRIVSISFLPSDPTVSSILFVQNKDVEEKPQGFIAPYLTEEEAEAWGAHRHYRGLTQLEFVEGLDEEIRVILMYFVNDASTKALSLTYEESGVYVTHSWFKG